MATQIKRQSEGAFFKEKRSFGKRSPTGWPVGPRTERRQKENRQLNKLQIKECELKIQSVCLRNKLLTWAHSKKSRFLVTSKDWQEAARCCLPCHQFIEALSHSEMKRVVLKAIKGRKKGNLPNGRNTDATGPNNARRFRQHVRAKADCVNPAEWVTDDFSVIKYERAALRALKAALDKVP